MSIKTKFLVIAVGIIGSVAAVAGTTQQSANGKAFLPSNFAQTPIAISGDNIYIAWFSGFVIVVVVLLSLFMLGRLL